MGKYLFELENVFYSYLGKFPALRSINLNISPGEKIAVIGANGSGKSTFLQMLDALIFPDSGLIRALGRPLNEGVFNEESFSLEFRRKVGFVFQNPDIQLFCPTVKEDIMFGPLQLGMDKGEIKKRFAAIVDILAISELLERAPHQLSIGEKRKAAIASTLVINPEILILDEPTAGLDPLTTRHIVDFLARDDLAEKTIITSTHDLHIVEEISDLVYVFSREKMIIKSGLPADILQDIPLLEENNLVHIHSHSHKGKVHVHPHQHRHIEHNHHQ